MDLLRSSGKFGVFWRTISFVEGGHEEPILWLKSEATLKEALRVLCNKSLYTKQQKKKNTFFFKAGLSIKRVSKEKNTHKHLPSPLGGANHNAVCISAQSVKTTVGFEAVNAGILYTRTQEKSTVFSKGRTKPKAHTSFQMY